MLQYITLHPRAKDLTGQRFGRLVALSPIRLVAKEGVLWSCQCDCGKIVELFTERLCAGGTKSCGCLRNEKAAARTTTHGLGKGHPWQVYHGIIQRCTNPKNPGYKNYGGRGITICPEWLSGYQFFHEHVTSLPNFGKKGYTIDRIDNSGNYEPGNVQWADRIQQAQNRRSLHMLTYDGKTQCIAAWEKETQFQHGAIYKRLRRGWSIEKALTTPMERRKLKSKK